MSQAHLTNRRLKTVFFLISVSFVMIALRLFYWQVIKSPSLRTQAVSQTINQDLISGTRGRIYTAEGNLLVGSQTVYQLFVNKKELEIDQLELVNQLVNLVSDEQEGQQDTDSTNDLEAKSDLDLAVKESVQPEKNQLNLRTNPDDLKQHLINRLDASNSWIRLMDNLSSEEKDIIRETRITGLHFIEDEARLYPEGSMAAHVTGFVGKDKHGNNTGYFGIEGALDKELQPSEKKIQVRRDGQGRRLADQKLDFTNLDGRDITLTIRRDLQFIAASELAKGVEQFHSSSGEVVIMDPKTGHILAMAVYPNYDPADYSAYSTEDYKNPILANLYEPGSTFKALTVAAGLDVGAINEGTICPYCTGPRNIAGYTIKTWNDEYNPGITIKEALRKSDNIAMIAAAESIGQEQLLEYLNKFGFAEAIDVDLQEDFKPPLADKLGPVELATVSFGQGISVNSLQMTRAFSALANQGLMMKPSLIKQVYDPQTNQTINYEPQLIRRVIQTETASKITELMVYAAPDRSNWIDQNYTVAGKTGTAQIPSPDGGYREQGTIASYIAFAPAEDPKFVMLVKLDKPKTSPWGATTAVPIWYEIADKIILRL